MDQARIDSPAFIAGDWGTTQSRFWLCAANGNPLDRRIGEGAAVFGGDEVALANEFDRITADWPIKVPAILCGMIGSMTGWHDSGYAACPADCADLGRDGLRFEHNGRSILLLPGLQTRNRFDEPDVMRGEEMQIVGAMDSLRGGKALVALPGTHNKWCLVSDGVVETFHTAMAGELRAILRAHSVLIGKLNGQAELGSAFELGASTAFAKTDVGLEALLFSTRARQAVGEITPDEAEEYLSGLLIGSDIATACKLYSEEIQSIPLYLICSASLASLYQRALSIMDLQATRLSGEDTVRKGLLRTYNAAFAL